MQSSSSALQSVFDTDDLEEKSLVRYQISLQPDIYRNYGSNMIGLFLFCKQNITPSPA